MSISKHLTIGALVACFVASGLPPQSLAAAPAAAPVAAETLAFQDFAKLRAALLTIIGGATTRIWLSTSFLTDGEIVSSLFIAQYRKVNIQVLLGRSRATNVFSRLSYLKQVNIPVALTPNKFYPEYPTILLVDGKLLAIKSSLNNLEKMRSFTISTVTPDQIPAFEAAFLSAAAGNDAPNAAPLPLVGRKNARALHKTDASGGHSGSPINTGSAPQESSPSPNVNSAPTGTTSADGSYRYTTSPDRPTSGIATKLPKSTILQERMRSRAENPSTTAPTSAPKH